MNYEKIYQQLIDWVKYNNPDVDPLDRIQWDIEAYS